MEEDKIKTRVVGVDISNERTTYAIVDIRGNIIAEDYFVTMDYENINNFVSVLCEKVLELVEANGGYETIRSLGISCPSASFITGNIVNAPNLPWKGIIPLAAMVRRSERSHQTRRGSAAEVIAAPRGGALCSRGPTRD